LAGKLTEYTTETIFIKNMVCECCCRVLKEEFNKAGIEVENIQLGMATIKYDPKKIKPEKIIKLLTANGFGLVTNREKILVEKIKLAVIELIHQLNNVDSIIRKSDYIVEKLGMTYSNLSRVFSRHEPITLEKYIILNKIERIKELIDQDEFTLSEIAFMMDYSSVAYLSGQFKQVTGITISDYKAEGGRLKIPLDKLTLI
jgi:AraC family transcriptional regulator